jgi:hypothetical protein
MLRMRRMRRAAPEQTLAERDGKQNKARCMCLNRTNIYKNLIDAIMTSTVQFNSSKIYSGDSVKKTWIYNGSGIFER